MTGRTCKICNGTGTVKLEPVNPGGTSIREDCHGIECDAVIAKIKARGKRTSLWGPDDFDGFPSKDAMINNADDRSASNG